MLRVDGYTQHRIRALTFLVTCVLVLVTLAGCGSNSAATNSSAAGATKSSPTSTRIKVSRIAVIVMENREYDEIVGRPAAPYINKLLPQFAIAANYHAVSHPSLPNYLALTGGSTFGFDGSDCLTCSVSKPNLIDELEAAGISWKAYMEGLPEVCSFAPSSGGYVRRHDPFMYYRDVAHNRSRCRFIVPASQLSRDLARHSLPSFVWLSPNLCHDMHSCGTYSGDRYLRSILPRLLGELGPTGILFLTWDEGETNAACCAVAKGGHILTLIAGPGARAGARSVVPYDHYSLLRTIEDLWGLRRLGWAACPCTHAMTDLLHVR
jgi:phosphatidylinositol-3-phosphatase